MIQITLPFKAISINEAYYGQKKFGMKKEAKEWCYQVNWALKEYISQFSQFKKDYKNNGLRVEFYFYYKNFYNKEGSISSKTLDLSNSEKILLDLVVDSRHYGPPPYKSPNLNINDSQVVELFSKKLEGPEDKIVIKILEID